MIGGRIAALYPLPEGAAERFDAFHSQLTVWNSRMDLTNVVSPEDALYTHYLDSLSGAYLLPQGASVVDVGTGAGFPGVPLKIARPDIHITLLDALAKRIQFLQSALPPIGIEAEAFHARAEDFARLRREAYDVAVSRAVASLPVLLEWMLPLVKPGGMCVLWKGPDVETELADARRVSPLLGGGAVEIKNAPVAGRDWKHVLVIAEKLEPTSGKFPRKAGMAVKRPLL